MNTCIYPLTLCTCSLQDTHDLVTIADLSLTRKLCLNHACPAENKCRKSYIWGSAKVFPQLTQIKCVCWTASDSHQCSALPMEYCYECWCCPGLCLRLIFYAEINCISQFHIVFIDCWSIRCLMLQPLLRISGTLSSPPFPFGAVMHCFFVDAQTGRKGMSKTMLFLNVPSGAWPKREGECERGTVSLE